MADEPLSARAAGMAADLRNFGYCGELDGDQAQRLFDAADAIEGTLALIERFEPLAQSTTLGQTE
jgi:hypothetical protein